jgi:ribosomal protein L37E
MLMQNPHAQGGDGEFIECPRCNKFIPHTAERCGFCGYPRRARRRMWWAVGTVAFVAALVTAVYGYRQVSGRSVTPTPPTTAQTPEEPAPTAAPVESTTAGGEGQQPAPSAESIVVTPSVPGASDSVRTAPATTAGAQVTPPPAPPRRPTTVPSTVNRWATTWANLREGPGTAYPVVRVLEPGERIRVASPTRGFWAVYDDDTIEGYVANSLLSDRQPRPDALPVTPPSRTR